MGIYIHFDLVLVESEIVLLDENIGRKIKGRFHKVGCVFPRGLPLQTKLRDL